MNCNSIGHISHLLLMLLLSCSHHGLPSSRGASMHLQPRVVHRRWHSSGYGGSADVADDAEGLPQGVVHTQHLIAVLGLLRRLFHQRVLVAT